MSEVRVVTADTLDPDRLDAFLRRAYPREKTEFLRHHAAWWYHGAQNRLVVVEGDAIAAYCAVIPTRCVIGGAMRDAIWWVDLFVAPEFRGHGLQGLLDEEAKHLGDLKLGFPNELAAGIHLKHGWGVRDEGRVLLFPVYPARLRSLRRQTGRRGLAVKAAARLLAPAAAAYRLRLSRYRPATARELTAPDAGLLAGIFTRTLDARTTTTCRDEAYLRWRYLDAPYRDQLRFYVAGPSAAPTQALVMRYLDVHGYRAARLLDLFGDLGDTAAVRDLLLRALQDAVNARVNQVICVTSVPALRPVLRATGFIYSEVSRFCWFSEDAGLMQAIAAAPCHWVLGDSDSDDPEEEYGAAATSAGVLGKGVTHA